MRRIFEQRIGVRVTTSHWQHLLEIAGDAGLTPSTVIRAFIEQPDLLKLVIIRLQQTDS